MFVFTSVRVPVIRLLILACLLATAAGGFAQSYADPAKIEAFIKDQMKEGRLPGVSVVVLEKGNVVLKRSYGYANISAQRKVTNSTRFEIGSNSKAFTALGILYLVRERKISLADPVTKYLPGFSMQYIGRKTGAITPSITIANLLYHTSGIPFRSIALIEADSAENALETTVGRLSGGLLDNLPGERFEYATINYDILGRLIEVVSKQPYAVFIRQNILLPLGLQETCLSREAAGEELATGYKFGFLQLQEYAAPMFGGNVPAGYIISNINDMEKWLRCQMNGVQDSCYQGLIEASHEPNRNILPNGEGASYAAGWQVFQNKEGAVAHGGSNPNYSSFIAFHRQRRTGVVVLANLNSTYTESMAKGILDIMEGKEPEVPDTDTYKQLNAAMAIMLLVSILFMLVTAWFMGRLLEDIIKGRRSLLNTINAGHVVSFLTSAAILGMIGYCLYLIPGALFNGLSWSFINVWAPVSFEPVLRICYIALAFFFLYYLCSSVFTKEGDRSLFAVITLSVIGGLGNTLIVLTINASIGRDHIFSSGFYCYFILGILLYIYCQRQLRTRLVYIVNSFVYTIRLKLINHLLNTPYERMEQLPKENLITVLSNDTEEVSNLPHVLVTLVTSIVTLSCCLAYLGFVNIWGLAISVSTIFTAASLYYYVSLKASKVWERTRNMQNIYIGFINSLVGGFKELRLNNRRNLEFEEDLQQNSNEYRESNIAAGKMFVSSFITGELIFTLVIGSVVFLFPLLLLGLDEQKVRTFVFIFLYMGGPVSLILNTFPQLTRIRISWKRIDSLKDKVSTLAISDNRRRLIYDGSPVNTLELVDVEYRYNDESSRFSVGPANYRFRSGEVVFITGGNGSGKSTIARIICGLYKPMGGEVRLNGKPVDNLKLSELCSAIFSDYHLFGKMYGIDSRAKQEIIRERLDVLQLSDKTTIDDGVFSTMRLSTGQRKRIALLVSYLEDKPICLFDEWAADQDPEFRAFFYDVLLPELKERNKCVIVISHDNHYFHVADRIIRMESGRLRIADPVLL
jgi:putative ATP-binding cassette transporter